MYVRSGRRRRSRFRPLPVARGFTIVEVVVALILLACGALAAVAASAAAIRAVASAETQIEATIAARTRLESLAAAGCLAVPDGAAADLSSGLRHRWRIAPTRSGLRLAIDSVQYADRDARRWLVLRRLLIC